jgi:hypothetical protein
VTKASSGSGPESSVLWDSGRPSEEFSDRRSPTALLLTTAGHNTRNARKMAIVSSAASCCHLRRCVRPIGSSERVMFVTMTPTCGNSSPTSYSTSATTRRGVVQLSACSVGRQQTLQFLIPALHNDDRRVAVSVVRSSAIDHWATTSKNRRFGCVSSCTNPPSNSTPGASTRKSDPSDTHLRRLQLGAVGVVPCHPGDHEGSCPPSDDTRTGADRSRPSVHRRASWR